MKKPFTASSPANGPEAILSARWILSSFLIGFALLSVDPAAAGSDREEREAAELVADLAERAKELGIHSIPLPNKLSDGMKEWLHNRVSRSAAPSDQLEQLLTAMQSRKGLEIQYEAGFTGTAIEVFVQERANCLSFSHLFVSFARELGLQAYYVSVDRMQRYRRSGDLIVLTGHVAAAWGYGTDRKLIEFNVIDKTDPRLARKIGDSTAHALYHANRGAELLQVGDHDGALKALTMAVILDIHLPDAWVNLGVARRRTDDLRGAEIAYRKAAELDPNYLPAYHNLLMLFDLEGDRDTVDEFFGILDRRSNRNPYIYLELGDLSSDYERFEEAKRFYRRAQRLDRTLAEPHAAMGLLALREGDKQQALEFLDKARDIDSEDDRTQLLARSLEQAPKGS